MHHVRLHEASQGVEVLPVQILLLQFGEFQDVLVELFDFAEHLLSIFWV